MKAPKGKKKVAKKKVTKRRKAKSNEQTFFHAVVDALLAAGAKNGLCAEHAFKEAFVIIGTIIVANDGPEALMSLADAALAIGLLENKEAKAEGRTE